MSDEQWFILLIITVIFGAVVVYIAGLYYWLKRLKKYEEYLQEVIRQRP